ncbi:MAG: S8 family peptidase [Bacteroidetes bacterium]|nr:S8 family peptidase [Bacteroidota bacterium]
MKYPKVILCICALILLPAYLYAQPQYVFRISLIDKVGSPPLSNPLAFLSQRAIDRRSNQGISIDTTDQPVSPTYINDILTTTGGKFHVTSRWMNDVVILLTDSSKITLLSGKYYINNIQYIGYYPAGLHKTTQDKWQRESVTPITGQPKTTGPGSAYYGGSFNQTDLVNGQYLHDRGYKGQGKLIAVMDEGFQDVNTGPAFDSMMTSGRLVDKYDFSYATTNVFTHGSHGTGCLSTIAGYIPSTYVGSAPLAQYALYLTECSPGDQPVEMDNMVAATERADSLGADVISSSLGYNVFNAPTVFSLTYAEIDGKTTIAAKGANMATSKGMLFVITAGNEGGGVPWSWILTPGDADSALTVGSVDMTKTPASNSGYGPNSANRIKPDVCLLGDYATIMLGTASSFAGNGTSYSTPQLAGWAACLWQASGNVKPSALRNAINKSAHVYNTPTKQLGYGVPDFYVASTIMGINDVSKKADANQWLIAVPNPFDKAPEVYIDMQETGTAEFSITDVAGRIIFSNSQQLVRGMQHVVFDIPELPRGTYYLKAVTATASATIRILKL